MLMLYRYLSGIYMLGDIAALSYVSGYLKGKNEAGSVSKVLTVSGHGIGEPELWLGQHMPNATIHATSFRLLNTQLLQFLRQSDDDGIEKAFRDARERFSNSVFLNEAFDDPGLVPYWQGASRDVRGLYSKGNFTVFSTWPTKLNPDDGYDIILVSHGARYLTKSIICALRGMLSDNGLLCILGPANAEERFANSPLATEGMALFNELLANAGYPAISESIWSDYGQAAAFHRELFKVRIPTDPASLLLGEMLVHALSEHISDRVMLQSLDRATENLRRVQGTGTELYELLLIEKRNSNHE